MKIIKMHGSASHKSVIYEENGEYKEAALNGDVEATARLGALLIRGGHEDEGIRLLKIAADAGSTRAAFTIGHYYYNDKRDYENAILWLEK